MGRGPTKTRNLISMGKGMDTLRVNLPRDITFFIEEYAEKNYNGNISATLRDIITEQIKVMKGQKS